MSCSTRNERVANVFIFKCCSKTELKYQTWLEFVNTYWTWSHSLSEEGWPGVARFPILLKSVQAKSKLYELSAVSFPLSSLVSRLSRFRWLSSRGPSRSFDVPVRWKRGGHVLMRNAILHYVRLLRSSSLRNERRWIVCWCVFLQLGSKVPNLYTANLTAATGNIGTVVYIYVRI